MSKIPQISPWSYFWVQCPRGGLIQEGLFEIIYDWSPINLVQEEAQKKFTQTKQNKTSHRVMFSIARQEESSAADDHDQPNVETSKKKYIWIKNPIHMDPVFCCIPGDSLQREFFVFCAKIIAVSPASLDCSSSSGGPLNFISKDPPPPGVRSPAGGCLEKTCSLAGPPGLRKPVLQEWASKNNL